MLSHRRDVSPTTYDVDPADRVMGLELEANEIEDELEWAEAQGRTADAGELRAKLETVVTQWGRAAEEATTFGPV